MTAQSPFIKFFSFRRRKDEVSSERFWAYSSLIVAVGIWGIATPIIKATVEEIPPITFLMIRFWISGIITLPFGIYYLKKIRIDFMRFKLLFFATVIGQVGTLILIFWGLQKTSAIEASIITSISPLLVLVMGVFLLKEIIQRHEIEGTLLAFIGTLIIIFEPLITGKNLYNGSKESFIGNLIFLGGVMLDGIYIVYVKKHLGRDKIIKPHILIVFSFLLATLIFTVLGTLEQRILFNQKYYGGVRICSVDDIDRALYTEELKCDNKGCFSVKGSRVIDNLISQHKQYECIIKDNVPNFWKDFIINLKGYFGSNAIWGVIYMSIFSGLLAYILFQIGLRIIEASEAALFYYLQPLFAIPIAIIFLHEIISPIYIIGAIIIAFGIYLAEKRVH